MLKKMIILMSCLLLIATFTSAQEAESPFTLQGDSNTPTIEHLANSRENRDNPYPEQYTDPGAVIYHDGQFHMFRNAFVGWPAAVWIHYMVSEDGITWEQPLQEPVVHTDDVPFAEVAALASSVIVEDDGTWVLYFYTWNWSAGNRSNGEIGRATADNPQGPWTVDPDPVLSLGEEGDFDEVGAGAPQVVRTDDGYLMYYEGINPRAQGRSIGLATSADGITWEKHPDNPIFEPVAEWEGSMTHQPRVLPTDDGFLMVYRAVLPERGGMQMGVATSEDGIIWERADAPILTPEMLDDVRAFWYTASAIVDDTYYLFIELTPMTASVTDIYTMTADVDALINLVD